MIIETKLVPGTGVHKNKFVSICILKCDQCGTQFERSKKKVEHHTTHTCCKECSAIAQRKGGVIEQRKKETCFTKHGVHYSSQRIDVKEKRLTTNLERYGAAALITITDIRKKFMLAKHGVEFASQSPAFKAKCRATCLERYGVEHWSKTEEGREKSRRCIQNRPFMMVSKKEIEFLSVLNSIYSDVQHQYRINGWYIDFYVPQLDLFIQYDGVYWHGLDGRINEAIKSRMLIDQQQNDWFRLNKRTLIRITEIEGDEVMTSSDPIKTLTDVMTNKIRSNNV